MNLEQLANEVFAKLESLAIQGFELGKEMVMKEIVFQVWLNKFCLGLGIILFVLGVGYFILLGLHKRFEWGAWDRHDDIVCDHGLWFAGCFFASAMIIAGSILVPASIVTLKHLEINPVYYILKHLVN